MDAAGSVCRNIAEGFGRYRHKEFANYLIIARGSLFELSDHVRDGMLRGHWNAETCKEIQGLCHRAIAGTTRMIRYLKTHADR